MLSTADAAALKESAAQMVTDIVGREGGYPCCERVEKKLQTRKCGSAYQNCATCSPHCYGAGGTVLNTCCIGPSGEDDINSGPCAATIDSADHLCPHSIYNCSTKSHF
jgi:hypothetical protein